MPGATATIRRSMVRATICPALRIFSISSGDLKMIMAAPGSARRKVAQRGHGSFEHLVLAPEGVDLAQQSPLRVVLEQRRGAFVVDLEPSPNHVLGVVGTLDQRTPASVADPGDLGRVELHVVRGLTVRADAAA